MALCETKIEIPASLVDEVDQVLLELGVEGWSLLEDALARRAWIVGIFADRLEGGRRWAELRPHLAATVAEPQWQELADADWRDSYRAHFKAWTFGRLHWVPVWEKDGFRLAPGHAVLWLDPGLAFGTGNHETTRLCIERLVACDQPWPAGARDRAKARVIDAGCGSGILALSAVLLGFASVSAFDLDPEATRVSRENAALNGLDGRVRFFTAGLAEGLEGAEAEIVLANIQADALVRHAGDLLGAVAPAGTLVLSGILAAETPQVRAAFAETAGAGWAIDSRTLGEWSDLALRRLA